MSLDHWTEIRRMELTETWSEIEFSGVCAVGANVSVIEKLISEKKKVSFEYQNC